MALVHGCQQLTPEARQQLADGAHAYQTGRYDAARRTLTQFIDEHREFPQVAEAHYLRGLCRLKLNQRTEARRDLEAAVAKASRTEVTYRAQAALAIMSYDDGDWETAVRFYKDAIPWLNDLRDYDDHLLRYGICLQRMGQWEQSASQFAQILHDYPKGPAAKTARYLLGWNRPYFTVQCHALSRSQAAAKEVARLRSLGLQAEQQLDTRTGRALYLIHVGKFRTYDEALRERQRVSRVAGLPSARVVP